MDFNLPTTTGAAEFMERARNPSNIFLRLEEHSKINKIPISGSCENFHKPENKNKNRFDYPCWDITRVVLAEKIDGSDYINANYIDGFHLKNKFIATEQPMQSTINSFWSMVWQENSQIIVQLTSPGEQSQLNYSLRDFIFEEENIYLKYNYTMTVLSLIHIETGEKRLIHRFNFLNWPENGAPDVQLFLELLLTVNKLYQEFFLQSLAERQTLPGPIVVQGLAGVGRTATFCAADFCLYQLIKTATVSIPSVVMGIRMQRNFSILSQDQYFFLNDILVHFLENIRSDSEMYLEMRMHFTDIDSYLINLKTKKIK